MKIRYPKEGLPFSKRYNIAPTQENLVIRKGPDNAGLTAAQMRWGLIPSWSKTGATPTLLINARSETIADKPSFKAAYQRRRCLVPADGYYEWKRLRSGAQPYYFQLLAEDLFYMAGIWECWQNDAAPPLYSYSILTTQANALAAKIHDRMPVILDDDRALEWLDANPAIFETDKRFSFFAPIAANLMQSRPVNPIVNNNQYDGPECIAAPPVEASTQLDMGF